MSVLAARSILAYRKALQEVVSAQLSMWGEGREPTEEVRRRKVRPVERDLEQVLVDLAKDFPLLASLVERRAGGQKRLPIGRGGEAQDGQGGRWPRRSLPQRSKRSVISTRSSEQTGIRGALRESRNRKAS